MRAPRRHPAGVPTDADPPLPGSIAQLDGLDIAKGAYGGPRVARLSRALRVPIDALSLGEIRFLLAQGRAVDRLMPVVIAKLEADPFLAAEAGVGDLLLTACVVADAAWSTDPPWREAFVGLVAGARRRVGDLDAVTRERLEPELDVAEARFGA